MNKVVYEIKLINDGKNELIADENIDLCIINIETMKISLKHTKVIKDKKLRNIALI